MSDRGNKTSIPPGRDQRQASLEKRQLSSRRCLLQITCQLVLLMESKEIEISGPPYGQPDIHPVPRLRKGGAKTLQPLYVITAWTEEVVPTRLCFISRLSLKNNRLVIKPIKN
jgi:hypothetical protein